MLNRALLLALLACSASTLAQYPEPGTGDALLRECAEAERFIDGHSGADMMLANGCVSYVSGYRDALNVWRLLDKDRQKICIPDVASNEKVIRALINDLRDNPRTLRVPRSTAMLVAMQRTFPCQK